MSTSASNFLKYTNLDYADIVQQISSRISSDSRFQNIKESSITQTLIEIFAGCVDLVTYYLQRRSEEVFVDTAKLRSSVILLARQLGYVVTRPIPAQTNIKVILQGDFTDLINGENPDIESGYKIQIPYHQNFTYDGNNYILKNTFTYTLTDTDITNMLKDGSDFILELTTDDDSQPINIVQGEIKEKIIDGSTNPFVGQKFQVYKIDDKEFSNIYGSEDYTPVVTKIWVGNNKSDDNEFDIDRKSLINWETLDEGNFVEGVVKKRICLIRTSIDEDVEVVFGDDRYAKIGAETSFDNIYVQYLATKGASVNKNGVIGKDIEYSGKIYGKTGKDITSKFSFKLNSNITGGADLESLESIKYGIPSIYYTLDRLVNKIDYKNYLKSLTSPINIKNAFAWGEQEEIELRKRFNNNTVVAIKELFNIVFFCCLGSLYDLETSPHYPRTKGKGLENAVLDVDFDENEFNGQSYFNIYTKNNVVEQLRTYSASDYYWQLDAGNKPTNQDKEYYVGQYDTHANLIISYTSDGLAYYPSHEKNVTISMDFSDLINTSGSDLMNEIALKIQDSLREIVDYRGGNRLNNANYGSTAFGNVTCTFEDSGKFRLKFDIDDICYVTSISATSNTSAVLHEELGFGVNDIIKRINVGTNVEISKNITDVIDKLNERGQVTIKHVYISPIIHNFDITGTIYVNSLYDKSSLKTQVEDAIYEWLDSNVDFNVPIYKSNIIEIIEGFEGVKYANIKFEPQPISGGPFYDLVTGDVAGIIRSYNTSASIISTISNKLNSFLDEINLNVSEEEKLYDKYVVETTDKTWKRKINERNFYTEFVKEVYNALENTAFAQNTSDFINVMSAIHKDFLTIIRKNMLDTDGNISAETLNGNYQRGGYSLGNEIVKMECKLTYVYKS